MLTKDIMIGDVNITAILNTIIEFIMNVVKFEFPKVGEIL